LNLSASKKVLALLMLLEIMILPALSEDSAVLLQPPGLRPTKNPSIIIPALYRYGNRALALPEYRDPSGRAGEGWAMEVIKTRRFFSNRSARLYFRNSDLAHSRVFNPSGSVWEMRIWPSGTLMVLETYEGDGATRTDAKPIEIAVMAKLEGHSTYSPRFFHHMDWSYAKFRPEGDLSLSSDEILHCHRCHSIAFQLTGDLIFTQFP
jgi:hypothetical protein